MGEATHGQPCPMPLPLTLIFFSGNAEKKRKIKASIRGIRCSLSGSVGLPTQSVHFRVGISRVAQGRSRQKSHPTFYCNALIQSRPAGDDSFGHHHALYKLLTDGSRRQLILSTSLHERLLRSPLFWGHKIFRAKVPHLHQTYYLPIMDGNQCSHDRALTSVVNGRQKPSDRVQKEPHTNFPPPDAAQPHLPLGSPLSLLKRNPPITHHQSDTFSSNEHRPLPRTVCSLACMYACSERSRDQKA